MSPPTCWGWKETKATLYACKNQLQRLNCLGPCFSQRRIAWGRGEGTFPSRIHLPRMAGRKNGHVGDWTGEDGKKHLESQRLLRTLLQGTRNNPVPPTPEWELPGFSVARYGQVYTQVWSEGGTWNWGVYTIGKGLNKEIYFSIPFFFKPFLSVQFSDIKYIHDVVQPPPLYPFPEIFHHPW